MPERKLWTLLCETCPASDVPESAMLPLAVRLLGARAPLLAQIGADGDGKAQHVERAAAEDAGPSQAAVLPQGVDGLSEVGFTVGDAHSEHAAEINVPDPVPGALRYTLSLDWDAARAPAGESRNRGVFARWCGSAGVDAATALEELARVEKTTDVHVIGVVLRIVNMEQRWMRVMFHPDIIDLMGDKTQPAPAELTRGIVIAPQSERTCTICGVDSTEANALTPLRLRWEGKLTPEGVKNCFVQRKEGDRTAVAHGTTFLFKLGYMILQDLLSELATGWPQQKHEPAEDAEYKMFVENMRRYLDVRPGEVDRFAATHHTNAGDVETSPLMRFIGDYRNKLLLAAQKARVRPRPDSIVADIVPQSDIKQALEPHAIDLTGYLLCMPECAASIKLCSALAAGLAQDGDTL